MKNQPEPLDYDTNPARFRTNVAAGEKYALQGDVHQEVAQRLLDESLTTVLDMGCGEGRFVVPARQMGLSVIALDQSMTMLNAISDDRLNGDARCLPFPDQSVDAVVALYMLYHLASPEIAIAEAFRVLSPGGLFVACAPSRFNDPELANVLPYGEPETFDAENGPDIIGSILGAVELERWDAPLLHLPDQRALQLYLQGRRLSESKIQQALSQISTPLTLTKRGALMFARKP